MSLDETTNADGENFSLLEVLSDRTQFEDDAVARVQFETAISKLPQREKYMLLLLASGKTQAETGGIMGMSQANVGRVVKKTYKKMKQQKII